MPTTILPKRRNGVDGGSAHLFPLTLLIAALAGLGCEDRNYAVTSSNVCRPNAGVDVPCFGVDRYWQFVVDSLLEVSARDFTRGDYVGSECEGEVQFANEWFPVWFNSWLPVDGFKHRMSGTLHHFNWMHEDDKDWNLHVVPSPAFAPLIDQVEVLHSEAIDEHRKCGARPCMEAETSPDKQFWSNPWFLWPGANALDVDGNGVSELEGREMGFYGLWVMDANHDFKSEIHPVEQLWWKDHFAQGFDGSGPFDIFWLLFLQDNTGRFDDPDNFDCGGDAPAGWEPWSESPRSGEFKIAFVVDPVREVVDFRIVELFKRFVVTRDHADARRDADDGRSHALEYEGKVVVRVDEQQPNDNDVGVTFTDLLLRTDGKLQGFVSIRSMIGGDDDKDEEGFHILYVVRSQSATRSPVTTPSVVALPRLLISSREVPGSLKRGADFLTGDLQLTLQGSDSTTPRDYTIARVDFTSGRGHEQVRFEQNARTREVVIRSVPLLSDGRITVTSASGFVSTLRIPSLRLSTVISDSLVRGSPDPDAWRLLAPSVGAIADATLPRDSALTRLEEVRLTLRTRYAGYRENELLTDRASTFADDMNQLVKQRDVKALESLRGSSEPFNVAWAFEARDVATSRMIPITRGSQRRADAVHVDVRSASLGDEFADVTFPSRPGGVIELRVTATVTDARRQTVIVEHRLWSHAVRSPAITVDALVSLVSALSGRTDQRALSVDPADTITEQHRQPDTSTRRARITRAYLKWALKDQQVSVGELRTIVGAVRGSIVR